MAILWYHTGAATHDAAQTDPAASLGGHISTSAMSATANLFFDAVSGDESAAGDSEYRCYAIKNAHATLSLQNAKVYMQTTTGNASDVVSFAVEVPSAATNGTCQTVGGEGTAPTVNAGNVSNWSTATTKATGIAMNLGAHDVNLDADEWIAVWVKRVISAGAAAADAETVTFRIEGDSAS
jgi:hypothetical protein